MADAKLPFVCVNCKIRKKACDKKYPSCTYCRTKSLACHYPSPPPEPTHSQTESDAQSYNPGRLQQPSIPIEELAPSAKADLMLLHSISDHAYLLPLSGFPRSDDTYDSIIYKRVSRVLQTTGLSLADVRDRYMSGLYMHMPIVEKDQFQYFQDSVVSSKPPTADNSVLMLALTLIVVDSSGNELITQLADQESLYLMTKMLYAQMQASMPWSLPLVQAQILLSMYEHLSRRGQAALLSIGACISMFQALNANYHNSPRPDVDSPGPTGWENVWWCMLACERIFACEILPQKHSFVLAFPNDSIPLPSSFHVQNEADPTTENGALPPLLRNLTNTCRGLTRTVQAAWLLDRVLSFTQVSPPMHTSQLAASALDQDLRSLLDSSLDLDVRLGGCCAAVSTVVCAMFIFHRHIVARVSDEPGVENWQSGSGAALDMVAQLMSDVAQAHAEGQFLRNIDAAPLNCGYVADAALDHYESRLFDFSGSLDLQSRQRNMEALKGLTSRLEKRWPGQTA